MDFDRNELFLPAEKTKSDKDRWVPMTQRVRSLLEMRKTGPDGKERKATTSRYLATTATSLEFAIRQLEQKRHASGSANTTEKDSTSDASADSQTPICVLGTRG